MLRRAFSYRILSLLALGVFLTASAGDVPKTTRPEQAAFSVKNVLAVRVPQGAQTVRVWFAVPQDDAFSVITNFNATTDHPVHYDWDSWGNKVGYLEVRAPTQPQITKAYG
jgi:hypothetical protein